jgi:hypothetical protein
MSWTPGQRLEIANPTRSWSPRRLPAADDGEAVASRAAEVVCSRRLQPSVQATYLTVIWRGETGTACSASVAVALPLEPFHRSARRRIRPCLVVHRARQAYGRAPDAGPGGTGAECGQIATKRLGAGGLEGRRRRVGAGEREDGGADRGGESGKSRT